MCGLGMFPLASDLVAKTAVRCEPRLPEMLCSSLLPKSVLCTSFPLRITRLATEVLKCRGLFVEAMEEPGCGGRTCQSIPLGFGKKGEKSKLVFCEDADGSYRCAPNWDHTGGCSCCTGVKQQSLNSQRKALLILQHLPGSHSARENGYLFLYLASLQPIPCITGSCNWILHVNHMGELSLIFMGRRCKKKKQSSPSKECCKWVMEIKCTATDCQFGLCIFKSYN